MILVDPWFQDSTVAQPIIEGLSGAKTIDFQIPKTNQSIDNYRPDAVLISHFHPHHSPAHDILQLANHQKKVIIAYPHSRYIESVQNQFSHHPNALHQLSKDGDVFRVGPFFVKAWEHTTEEHVAWSIESSTGHVVHIADARINSNITLSSVDPLWKKFTGQDFDIAFLTAGKSNILTGGGTTADITEGCILTPVQAAKLTRLLQPKVVALIGIYNHSLWADWKEYRMSAGDCEQEYRWALNHLSPYTRFTSLYPGYQFGIQNHQLLDHVDTYIK